MENKNQNEVISTESIGVTEMLTKELNGWFGTEDNSIACKLDSTSVTIGYKSFLDERHTMISLSKEVILEIAEKIKSEESN